MTKAVESPPDVAEAPSAPERRVEDPAAPLLDALNQLLEDWTERLDGELTGRVRDVLSNARDAHRAAMEEAGLVPGGDGAPPSFDAMRQYRLAVHGTVILPILQLANEADPGRRVGRLMDGLYDGLVELARDAPATVKRTAPPDQYRPTEEDGPFRSALKGLFRGGRGVTGLFRTGLPEQTVRLRSIAAAALQPEGVASRTTTSEELFQYHARPLQRIEMALGTWMRDWMPLENAGHDLEAHLEPDDRTRLAALREQLREASVEGATPAPEEGGGETEDGDAGEAPEAGNGAAAPDAPASPPAETTAEVLDAGGVAARLQEALDGVADLPPPEGFLTDLRQRFDRLGKRLENRIREGGTPFARTAVPSPRQVARYRKRREDRREEWREWFDATIDRIRLTDEFLSLRADGGSILGGLYGSTLDDSVFFLAERIEDSQEGLLSLRNRTREADSQGDAEDPEVAEAMASDTRSIEEDARNLLEERLLEPLRERNPRARVEQAASESVEALGDRLGHLPRTLTVHPIRAPEDVVDPDQPVRTIPVREIARQGLDVLHLEGLRTTPAPLLDYLTRVEGECRQVVEMVAYSLSSAREALLAGSSSEEDAEEDPDAPPPPEPDEAEDRVDEEKTGVEAAQTLSLEGLERAADSLEVILAPAITAWDEFAEAAHETLRDAREQMHGRLVVEGTVQEQLRDVRSLVRSYWRAGLDRARALQRQYGPALRRRAMRLYIRGLRLVRRGQSAVGGGDTRKTERAAEVLGRIPTLLDPLPLIYRRLYSFQPLTDPGLMVGRGKDRTWLADQYARWTEGSCPPVVLTGGMAIGHTSFMNVMAQELIPEDGAVPLVRVLPTTRYLEETAVATRLARGLWGEEAESLLAETGDEGDVITGSPEEPSQPSAPAWTFSRVERVLRSRNEQRAVFLERLEHFLIRVPGGCSLAERFLAFQSRTAGQVFWVNSVSDPAWKLLTTTEPHAYGLVQVRRLEPPDRKTMEELLLTRHSRSGVPLEFVEHGDLNPLVRRKLKRARTEKERQDILRTDFFDWIYRASQGSVLMAILMWLRSADFTSRPGWLRMKPSRAIRFAFLEEMDLPTSFALKAFLEHESLTLEEYSRIFAVSHEEAFQTLEILRRKVLIDRLDTPGSLPVPVRRLEKGVRYRIPPIITQVIGQNLKGQNILH